MGFIDNWIQWLFSLIINYNPLTMFPLTSAALILINYYFLYIVQKPKLVCKSEKLQKFLIVNCPILMEDYWPTIWCWETHLMTFFSNFLREWKAPIIEYKRELIRTPDGGQISLDWYSKNTKNHENDDRPIALFLPGLTGSSQSEYIRPLVKIASDIGYRSVVLNHRGIAETALLTPRLYCAANDDDIRTALEHIRKHNPKARKLIASGVSLGGIILTRYLITSGSQSKIDAAFLISVCFDFLPTNANMERLVNFPLNNYLTRLMIGLVNGHSPLFENLTKIDMKQVRNARSLREFDESFTRKMFNFESVEHYYKESSYKNRLQSIKTLTLAINSSDDMFSPESTLPCEIIEKESDHVALVVTSHGGHIGFMEGLFPFLQKDTSEYFLERLARQYFEALYESKFPDFDVNVTESNKS